MAAQWIDIQGPVVGTTAYVDSTLVAKDMDIVLPPITPLMVEIKAMGTYNAAIWALLESLEVSITKIGYDEGYISMISPKQLQLENRWVVPKITDNGQDGYVGMKAFFTGCLKDIPSMTVSVGTQLESPLKYELKRYELYSDNKEIVLIDRFAHKLSIGGVDYYSEIASLL